MKTKIKKLKKQNKMKKEWDKEGKKKKDKIG